jgi:long-subunit acyl-CoA synthetase (AMP-forming)
MARQGFAFLTSDDVRVVKLTPEGEEPDVNAPLVEVEADGQEVGEIVCRGNITMKGYWNKPEETEKAFRGGWLNTGDLAVRFPDGTFAITDRSKDLIISCVPCFASSRTSHFPSRFSLVDLL